ncbi:hypothetical protein M378DRAFT_17535 [Amanita muscaria Koide BX008]|uniref:Uncharacterized protein n=1 Tax=Amanita muscaria (strain Koide BX008) TaxID=946122 RepID=A0A0C2WGX6_AMAMK|nr:hypothetical protein M378DRAFT_17535 [Amanita muscaria Koide BX008]
MRITGHLISQAGVARRGVPVSNEAGEGNFEPGKHEFPSLGNKDDEEALIGTERPAKKPVLLQLPIKPWTTAMKCCENIPNHGHAQACNVLFNPKAAGGNGAPLSLSSPWMHRSRHVVIPYITQCLSWPTRPPRSASSASRSQVLSQRFSPDDICNAIIHVPPLLYRSCIYTLALLSSKGLFRLNTSHHLPAGPQERIQPPTTSSGCHHGIP